MNEKDIFSPTVGHKSLEHLEDDIWKGVEAYTRGRRASRMVMSCQVGIGVVALFGAAFAGATTASAVSVGRPAIAAAGAELAPSALLLGVRP